MTKKLVEIASEIVQTQVSISPMSASEIASSLRQIFKTLQEMQKSETENMELTAGQEPAPASEEMTSERIEQRIAPEDSIQENRVICIECGKEMRQLTAKHLGSHGLSQKEYKKKHGFPLRTPLAAKSLTKARSRAAKKRGLPENLTKFVEARRQSKAEAKTNPEKNPGEEMEGGKKARSSRKEQAA